ncbi:hypothetical protein J2858_003132 [Neorhizobium galegae]|uniref:hypothetical protein n=1 Tax=Neorhizobium galegae TaxID=399 RepID=UPI001AE1F09A|nr:hypothetical protein [Neorhizobium galegae]MBP2550196.1 hypothetical protein [Neorhizobium galegae]
MIRVAPSQPAQTARDQERARLARLSDIAERCGRDQWSITAEAREVHITTRRSTGEDAKLCTIHDGALADEIELISAALENVVLFLALRQRAVIAFNELQRQSNPAPQTPAPHKLKAGDFAANAAMLLTRQEFHRFLERKDASRVIHTNEHADTVLKALLGITSKSQLNTQRQAQGAFLQLRADFETWVQRGCR